MKIRKLYLFFVIGVVLGALLGSFLYVGSLGEAPNKAVAFVTLGAEPLQNETSTYEIQRAAEHFSYIVLGWLIEPSFADEYGLDYQFDGRHQEKQSMIFTVYGDFGDTQPAELLVQKVKDRIAEYNENSDASYTVALERYSFVEGERSDWRFVAGVTLLSLVFAVLLLMIFENVYAARYRSSFIA